LVGAEYFALRLRKNSSALARVLFRGNFFSSAINAFSPVGASAKSAMALKYLK
jgi:hypothetical protein